MPLQETAPDSPSVAQLPAATVSDQLTGYADRMRTQLEAHAPGAYVAGGSPMEQAEARRPAARFADQLRFERRIDPQLIATCEADLAGTTVVNPLVTPPSPGLVDRLGASICARHGLLPWRNHGGTITVLTARPEQFARHDDLLRRTFGRVRMGIATEDTVFTYLQSFFGPSLAHAAEHRTAPEQSCRRWSELRIGPLGLLLLICAAALAIFAPVASLATLIVISIIAMVAFTALRITAGILFLIPSRAPPDNPPVASHTPTISVLVPLHREDRIASHLLHHLGKLDYPRASLDILLILETNDDTTAQAIAATKLPSWIRTVLVPDGALKTKPRAMNYALDFCRGSIIGVYDAEDAPAPDQLRKVVDHFAASPPEVACLQGVLDFYNAKANWMSRCFAVEYATWFRVMLPGIARMGLPIPLGGTTLFFRRRALEELGGWDAHNVTEDADLGIRLARAGYRTELIETVTMEEANNRFWPWVRQRSRWLKGYALTYGVHMSRPRRLWKDLGPWRFFGVQALFLGTLLQIVLAPVLWSFWLVLIGLPHPLEGLMAPAVVRNLAIGFIAAELSVVTVGIFAVIASGRKWLIPWVPTLHFYFPIATIAAYKALWEIFTCPFYWDKTSHGSSIAEVIPPPEPPPRRGAAGFQRPPRYEP